MNTNILRDSLLPCDTEAPFVFVSYSKADSDTVYPIVIELQALGYNIWIDKELDGKAGDSWTDEALLAISSRRCKSILFFVSENSMCSAPVGAELFFSQHSLAVKRDNGGKSLKIIPIIATDTWMPQKAPLSKWVDDIMNSDYQNLNLSKGDYDILDKVKVCRSYIDQKDPDCMRDRTHIADFIYREVLIPLSGDHLTFVDGRNLETIEKNIDSSCKKSPTVTLVSSAALAKNVLSKSTVPAKSQNATVRENSSAPDLIYSMTLSEFRRYVGDPANTPTLKTIWSGMEKIPGYVVFGALLGGPGVGGDARKIFVSDVAEIKSNGVPNAGTWSSAIAGCINNSRKLEEAKEAYPALSENLRVEEVRKMFDDEVSSAFISRSSKKAAILNTFDKLFL